MKDFILKALAEVQNGYSLRAGSGNTANIASIHGTIDDFSTGNGVFVSEAEFLEYWRGYKRTSRERQSAYSNIHEFRAGRTP